VSEDKGQTPTMTRKRTHVLRAARVVLVIAGLAAWFGSQAMLGARQFHGPIDDRVLEWLSPWHNYLVAHAAARNGLLIASSALIDMLGIYLLAQSIFGKTLRPFVGLLMLFALRQSMQALCMLPTPEGMIWPREGPGFPSLLVTYGVGNDLFFSGHTALAVYGAVELARLRKGLIPVGIFIALFEMLAVLTLRVHWTMDVYAGAVTALLVAFVAGPVARPVDRFVARFVR